MFVFSNLTKYLDYINLIPIHVTELILEYDDKENCVFVCLLLNICSVLFDQWRCSVAIGIMFAWWIIRHCSMAKSSVFPKWHLGHSGVFFEIDKDFLVIIIIVIVSWLQGNAFPSFSVAFQHGLKNDARLTIDVCYLPNQHLIYFLYILSLCISVALTIFGNRRKNVVEMKLKHWNDFLWKIVHFLILFSTFSFFVQFNSCLLVSILIMTFFDFKDL